jgi:serine/threonine protein kinase
MSLSLYPIIKELGDGGFGKTYLATNTLLPSRPYCVLKQLKPVASAPQLQQLIRDRFEKEGAILESLGNSSNGKIPRLYAYFVEQGEFYLIQEYVDGQTLTERVRTHGLFTEREVKDLLTNILPTLAYVHGKGIVHRDIKPDNIMLRRDDNTPILIDFGAVKETMGTTVTASGNSTRSIVIGTPGFMPVEQISGRPMFASDIYALGLTAIYVLTGRLPSEIETNPSTGEIDWQPHALGVSPQLIGIIDKAIQPSSRDRYTSANEMLAALAPTPQPLPPTQPVNIQPPAATVVSSATNSQAQTVYVPPGQQYQPQQTSRNRSNSPNPILAAIIGVIVGGVLIALGLLLGRNFGTPEKVATVSNTTNSNTATTPDPSPSNSSNASNSPTPVNSPPSATPSPSPASIQSPSPNGLPSAPAIASPTQTTPVANSSTISRDGAVNVVKQWLAYKQVLLAPPYNKAPGADILYGKAYRDNIDKSADPCNSSNSDDCLSSVDWLQKYNAQYSFGVQRVDSIDRFESSGDTGTIFVTITEYRTLHKTGGRTVSSGGTKKARYDLRYEDGKVKIADYKVLD